MSFIVKASRAEDTLVTVRLSVVVAIAKAHALLDEGWQVSITAPDGVSYHPADFNRLLLQSPALRREADA